MTQTNGASEKAADHSVEIDNVDLQKLQVLFPQFIKDGKVDFAALKAWFDKNAALADADEKYGLGWAGKTDAIQAIRRPSTGTLKPDKIQSKDWDTTQNLFIEGDNLETLKLLMRHYGDKVKMIYIDPPYNTGRDFVYTDNFTEGVSDYYARTGQGKDGPNYSTNSSANGRYHSNWLNMMYPRLFYAKQILRDDGVIFVSINDIEIHNLRHVMDEVFGEDNFIHALKWKRKKQPSYIHGHVASVMEYILVYARNAENLEKLSITSRSDLNSRLDNAGNPVSERIFRPGVRVKLPVPSGVIKKGVYKIKTSEIEYINDVVYENGETINEVTVKARFRNNQSQIDSFIASGLLFITKNTGLRRDLTEEEKDKRKMISDLLLDWGDNQDSDKEQAVLFPGGKVFSYPKPTQLIYNLAKSLVSQDDIIMDFFAGSGTTAEAVMRLNADDEGGRTWIAVQLPEDLDKNLETAEQNERIIFENAIALVDNMKRPHNLTEVAKERIRRAGQKILQDNAKALKGRKIPLDVGFKVFTLSQSNYRRWQPVDAESVNFQQQLLEQAKLSVNHPLIDGYAELDVVYEIALKEGADLHARITHKTVNGLDLYRVEDTERQLIVCFADTLTQDAVEGLGLSADDVFVCLDVALNDSDKTNLLQNIRLKTI